MSAPANEAVFVNILGRTFRIAAMVTIACFVLGFPAAYVLANLPERTANLLMILVLLPFWTSLLVRTAAWVVVLQREGVINDLLLDLHLISAPVPMIFNRVAVYVAMTHILLPFMILPLYSIMKSIPPAHLRAAASLGARPFTAFRRVYLPQTIPGIGGGRADGLHPGARLLHHPGPCRRARGSDDQLFIAFYASRTINWGMAAALSVMLLVATMILYSIYSRLVGFERLRLA